MEKGQVMRRCTIILILCSTMLLGGCGEGAGPDGGASLEPLESRTTEGEVEADLDVQIARSSLLQVENPQEENMAGLLQEVASGMMVQLGSGDVTGSGVLWKTVGDELVIVTAAHVLAMGDGAVQVEFIDGWTVEAAGYEMTNQDVAFVFVELQGCSEEQLSRYRLINVRDESAQQMQRGDGIVVMASGTDVAANAYEGEVSEPWIYVEDFDQHMIVVRADVEPGMSGGGLFDLQGHFLGIICGKSEDGEAAVIPLSVIEALYESF